MASPKGAKPLTIRGSGHFRAFEITWDLFWQCKKRLFIHNNWLKIEVAYFLPRGKVYFDRGYKFYQGSCLGCLTCSYGADRPDRYGLTAL